uniref:Trimethylamine methyltransferase n=1 Tax=Candidatus Methanomethylicus mesodigestus TaxID=1867258 RepID=A0A7C3EQX9_9CREN
MAKAGLVLKSKPWEILDKDQLKTLDNVAYEILRDVGVFMEDEELLKMAKGMGASVDFEKKIVKDIPEDVVREDVKKAPKNFILAGRDPGWDLVFEDGVRRQTWAPECGATDALIWDSVNKSYHRKRASAKDTAYAAKIVDGIDDFDHNIYLYDTAEEGQQGLPSELHRMNAMLRNTTKWAGHLTTTVSDIKEHDYVMKLGAIVAGGEEEFRKRPLFWSVYNYIGALQLNRFNSWLLRASMKHHIPIMPAVTSAAPLMAPATSAGNTALSHAGCLWLTALKQHYDPGVAVVENNIVFCLDPYTGRGTLPSSHFLYGQVAMNQLWHNLYGLPVAQYSGTGACSLDQQAFTLMGSMMFQVAMQTDMIFIQFAAEALDPVMIPIAAEIAHYGKHLASTFSQILPTEENLALKLMKEIGPIGQPWMTTDFNMERIEMFYKALTLDTRPLDTWLVEGAQSWAHDLCRAKLKEMEKHEPMPLPKDVQERMDAVVKEGTDLLKRQ